MQRFTRHLETMISAGSVLDFPDRSAGDRVTHGEPPCSRKSTGWVLAVFALLCSLPACGAHASCQRGLYVSLGYSYYPRPLPDQAALRQEAFDVVLPELGVFDPSGLLLTDFAHSFQVQLTHDAEENDGARAALESLPARCRATFGAQVRVVAWVFLRREEMSAANDGTAQGPVSPLFDPGDRDHRAALIRAAVELEALGFDGVQLDLEPFPTSDVPDMVRILRGIRKATSSTFARSVFCPKFAAEKSSEFVHPGFTWHARQPYRRLACHSESIIIPLYDYGRLADTESEYRKRVAETVGALLPRVSLWGRYWFAIPAFRNTPDHPPAEKMATALDIVDHGRRQPGGVVFFVHTGEPVDYIPEGRVPEGEHEGQ